MRNMLALFGAALLTVVGVGWYLGWYKVRSQPASVPGQHSVNIDIDTNKIGKDLQKGEQRLQHLLENKGHNETGKGGDLMLPSPLLNDSKGADTDSGSTLKLNTSDKAPLFQFHTSKGTAVEVGGDKGPLIQFQAGDKGPMIQFGGNDKK
jgi:hypothetical protein